MLSRTGRVFQETIPAALASAPEVAVDQQTIDRIIGEQIRRRRAEIGLSQNAVGAELNLSYQQIQKYESGKNRVSSSMLYDIAAVLKVPVSYFFEPLMPPEERSGKEDQSSRERMSYVATNEGQHLIDTFRYLPAQVRSSLLGMMVGLGRCTESSNSE